MSDFAASKAVEAEAITRLLPYMQEKAGRFVLNEKGPLAKELQETVGDALVTQRGTGRLVSVEVKAERRHTGNLFIECWSNLNLDSAESWEARGSNPGWAWKMYPGLLFYYFLEPDALYIVKGYKLWRWMHATPSKSGALGATRIHDFKRVRQSKAQQLNDTWGHLVPVTVINAEVGVQVVYPLSYSKVAA